MMKHVVQDFSRLLDQSLLILTSFQEDPTIQKVKTEAWELHQGYDTTQGAM